MKRIAGLALIIMAAMLPHAGAGDALAVPDDVLVVFQPRHEVRLSAEVGSTVIRLNKEIGQTFAEGEVLIELDPTAFKAKLDQVEARLAASKAKLKANEALYANRTAAETVKKAEAALQRARLILQNKESLYRSKSLSTVELAEAQTAVTIAEVDVVIAEKNLAASEAQYALDQKTIASDIQIHEADLALMKKSLEACTVRAPFAGRIDKLHVREAEAVQASSALLDLVDDRTLLAQFLAPSTALPELDIGDPVQIRVSETGARVTGSISHVGARIDPTSSTIKVWVEIDNEGGALRGGMRGILSLRSLLTGGATGE